jgi:hypothetical protein
MVGGNCPACASARGEAAGREDDFVRCLPLTMRPTILYKF